MVRQELIIKSVTSQMEAFDRSELRHTEVVERNSLPDADTLRQERGKADLLSGGDFYDIFLNLDFTDVPH